MKRNTLFCRLMLLVASAIWAQGALAQVGALQKQSDFSPKPVSDATMRADIEAADRWVRDYYAAWVDPENSAFRATWRRAVIDARRQAGRVRNTADWQLVLRRLLGVARDGHVQFGLSSYPQTVRWAGVSVALNGDSFTLRSMEHTELDGAKLIACDGAPIQTLAKRRLDRYQVDWTNPSERQYGVSRLFVDRGDTLLRPIHECRIRKNGKTWLWRPVWSERAVADVRRAANTAARLGTGRSSFDVRMTAERGLWISVPSLADSAAARRQRDDIASDARRLSTATHIVFDVRGNSGGSSELGDALLLTTLGWPELPVASAADAKEMWRVSPGIVRVLEAARVATAADDPESIAFFDKVLPALRAAAAAGLTIVADPREAARPSAPQARAAVPKHPPIFVLTDGDCFSSCILFVNRVRALGGLQVGDPTNRNGQYGEIYFNRMLPSGMGSLVLPLAIERSPDELRGGRPPDLPWTGDMSDQRGIETFIARKVSG